MLMYSVIVKPEKGEKNAVFLSLERVIQETLPNIAIGYGK